MKQNKNLNRKQILNKKKILFIPMHLEHSRYLPLGVAYIASYLIKHGYIARIYDPQPFKKFNAIREIEKFRPDIIGISCMTPTFWDACQIAKQIKSRFKTKIVFGGIHPTSVPEEVIKNEFVDYVIYGEGEQTMLELLEALDNKKDLEDIDGLVYKKNNIIIKNKPRKLITNLDNLPLPARQLFPKWYFMRCMCIRGLWLKGTNVMASRGCPYGCTYCASKVLFGRGARFRSAKNIADELEHLIKKYGLNAFWFSDDTFTANKKLAKEICLEIKKRKLKFKWGVQARADCVDDEIVKLLKEAGCVQFDVGVESGSERILKILNKGITVEQIKGAFKLFRKYKIRTCATFMIGNPGETLDDIRKTVELVKEIKADYTQFFITTPYPGTPMYNELKGEDKLVNRDYREFRHGGPALQSLIKSDIPADILVKIQSNLNERFLRNAIRGLVLNFYFWLDTLLLLIQKPSVFLRGIKNFWNTGKITELYRTIYYSHNLRRF